MDVANKILYKEESFAIIGACMKVHRTLGAGFVKFGLIRKISTK